MEQIGKNVTALDQRSIGLTQPSTDRLKLANYHSRLIFGCYRADQFSDPEVFVTAVALVLSQYPQEVGAQLSNPKTGIASYSKWPPAIAEIREACDQIMAPSQRAVVRQASITEQLRERDEIEAAPRPRQTYEEFKAEMAGRGMPIDNASRTFETAESVKAKYGVSDDAWNAIADLPKRVTDKSTERLR